MIEGVSVLNPPLSTASILRITGWTYTELMNTPADIVQSYLVLNSEMDKHAHESTEDAGKTSFEREVGNFKNGKAEDFNERSLPSTPLEEAFIDG